ncbi:gamma-glutamyltransferase [Fonticella tunisiensis]|uniref:Glutathione hydrolase proenzyme n=1 Tax=Fonticella tunisiensis TaxID=1096341 RepID=A0A4R7K681_9CLOT|nr:gamma-glutamyltransferase [Fonticella tunisiensis]TDT46032.1 gamma-glutamyltranspeptidase/glutathione hydrolase [Fonticella tunisiensis]
MKVMHRGVVMSKRGMVCSAHPLSSWVGADVLNKGGNAMDATIAMALATGVVLPDMCGLGGDAFMLYYEGKTGKVYAINGSGGAPANATREYFVSNGYKRIPGTGMLSTTVPGAVGVYFKSLSLFGSMEFKDLASYAIKYAEEGIPVSQKVHRHMRIELEKLRAFQSTAKIFLKNGEPYKPGEILKNPDYANSLKTICKQGEDSFYKGELAHKILDYSKSHGGLYEASDFAAYKPVLCEPIKTEYRGYTVYQTPPVSQGVIVLEELNILEGYDLKSIGADCADSIHLMVESKKLAFADRIKYFGDPDFVKNPIKGVLSKEYADALRKRIDINNANFKNLDVCPYDYDGDTTSMVAVDKWGNAVSFIHSISASFGCGEVIEGTGILLNNRAGTGFNLTKGHPNCIAPGKKTMHTLNTWLITKNGKLKWVGNTPGGDNQPQWNMQLIVNLIDFEMNVQEAVEAPKWIDVQSTNPLDGWDGKTELRIESRISEEVINELKKKGHKVVLLEPYGASGASQVIEVNDDGVMFGGSDPRADGCAIGI